MTYRFCPGCGAELNKHAFVSTGLTIDNEGIFLCRNCWDIYEFSKKRPAPEASPERTEDKGPCLLCQKIPCKCGWLRMLVCPKCFNKDCECFPTPDRIAELREKYKMRLESIERSIAFIHSQSDAFRWSADSAQRLLEMGQQKDYIADINELLDALEAKEKVSSSYPKTTRGVSSLAETQANLECIGEFLKSLISKT